MRFVKIVAVKGITGNFAKFTIYFPVWLKSMHEISANVCVECLGIVNINARKAQAYLAYK
jgi:hypothetical protein